MKCLDQWEVVQARSPSSGAAYAPCVGADLETAPVCARKEGKEGQTLTAVAGVKAGSMVLPAPYSRQGNKQCERVGWRGKEEEETEKAESRRQKSWGSDCESRAPLAAGLKRYEYDMMLRLGPLQVLLYVPQNSPSCFISGYLG
jgi:hypothetical protein